MDGVEYAGNPRLCTSETGADGAGLRIEGGRMVTHRSLIRGVVLTFLLCAAGPAAAAPVADFTGGADSSGGLDTTFGWDFTVTSAITIGALGLFDIGANGFASSHDVGLW